MPITSESIKKHIKRQQKLRADRANWDTMWSELSTYLCPGRITTLTHRSKGSKVRPILYDTTGGLSAQRLAAGLYARTVNPASKWFFLTADDTDQELMDNPAVAQWFDIARNVSQANMNKHATGTFFQAYLDLVTLGSACIFIEEVPLEGARYFTYPIDQLDIAEDYLGKVDTVYRKFKLTRHQIKQEFPETYSKLKDFEKKLEKDPDEELEIIHCVYPRQDRDPDKYDNLNMPYASLYIAIEEQILLSESGYPEMPYAIPRLEVLTGEKYGRGPGNIALPEVKALNELQKVRLDNAHMKARPPLDVPLNAYVNPLHLIPGYKNLNQDETGKKASAMHVVGDLNYQTADIRESRNIIKEIFYNDQLNLREGPQMTATEVRERMDLQMQLMGPWQGRLEPEFYEPVVMRTVAINLRQGLIPPPPEELLVTEFDPIKKQLRVTGETKNIKTMYDSPLARAQRLTDISVIDNTKMSLANIASVNPQSAIQISSQFRLDLMEVDRAKSLGLPNKYFKTQPELQAEAEAQQKAIAEQKALTAASEGSKAIKNIKDTPGADQLTSKLMSALAGGE